MIDYQSIYLLVSALVAVIGLIVLIAVVKLNPFLSLFLTSLALAVATGMTPAAIIHSFEAGVGGTLGHIAVVVALGTMLGKMMAESGGAGQIANTMIRIFGPKRVHWAMALIGLVVGLPAFFEVGFVLLIPIAFTVARRTRTSLVLVGLPMLAGLSVVHGLVPPHPAALMAVTIYKADVGRTIFYALLVGLPTALIAGPIYAKLIAPHIKLPEVNPMEAEFVDHDAEHNLPSFGLTLLTIILPVVLMLAGSWADAITTSGSVCSALSLWVRCGVSRARQFCASAMSAWLRQPQLRFWWARAEDLDEFCKTAAFRRRLSRLRCKVTFRCCYWLGCWPR
jgi:GntP family gluconate:H+ symporter